MKYDTCLIVEELLPLYIEKVTSPDITVLIEEHLNFCPACAGVYKDLTAGIHIKLETEKTDFHTVRYINGIKLWYLLCPLMALLLQCLGFSEILRLYKGFLILCSICFIASEVHHRATWWDPDCTRLQENVRTSSKKRWGSFYTRPILIALPSVLVVLVLELPRLFHFL